MGSAVSAKTVAPGEPAPARGAQVGLLPRVDAPMRLQRLAAGEVGAALVAPVFLRLVVDALLVHPHVPQLREAFAAHGAKVRLLPGVNAPVNLQVPAAVEALLADETGVRPLARVLVHVPFQPFRAGEAALAHAAPERLLPRVGAGMAAQLRGLEEAHLAAVAPVRLFRLLLVRPLVRLAVAHLRERFPADVAEEGLLSGVRPRVPDEFVELGEGLRAVRALVGLPWLLGVRALVSL